MKRRLAKLMALIMATTALSVPTFANTYNANGTLKGDGMPTVPCVINTDSGMINMQAIIYNNKTYLPLNTFRELKVDDVNNVSVGYATVPDGSAIITSIDINFVRSSAMDDYVSFTLDNNTGKPEDWKYSVSDKDLSVGAVPNIVDQAMPEGTFVINSNGYNYVPISIFRDSLGLEVNWEPNTKTVTITGRTNWPKGNVESEVKEPAFSGSFGMGDYKFEYNEKTSDEEYGKAIDDFYEYVKDMTMEEAIALESTGEDLNNVPEYMYDVFGSYFGFMKKTAIAAKEANKTAESKRKVFENFQGVTLGVAFLGIMLNEVVSEEVDAETAKKYYEDCLNQDMELLDTPIFTKKAVKACKEAMEKEYKATKDYKKAIVKYICSLIENAEVDAEMLKGNM